jgi:hypothetical protein
MNVMPLDPRHLHNICSHTNMAAEEGTTLSNVQHEEQLRRRSIPAALHGFYISKASSFLPPRASEHSLLVTVW